MGTMPELNEQNQQIEIAISPMASGPTGPSGPSGPSGLSSRQLSSVPPVAFHELPLDRHHSHHLQYSQQISNLSAFPTHSRGIRAQSTQIARNPMYYRSEMKHEVDGRHQTLPMDILTVINTE